MTHRRKEPGGNDDERTAYHMAQQRLRYFARRGYLLEVDEDGAPMPCATGTSERMSDDPDTLASSMPALKVRSATVLGQAIRMWRRRCNLSGPEVADRASLSKRSISDLEAGKPGVSIGRVLRMLDAMGLELLVRPKRAAPPAGSTASLDDNPDRDRDAPLHLDLDANDG